MTSPALIKHPVLETLRNSPTGSTGVLQWKSWQWKGTIQRGRTKKDAECCWHFDPCKHITPGTLAERQLCPKCHDMTMNYNDISGLLDWLSKSLILSDFFWSRSHCFWTRYRSFPRAWYRRKLAKTLVCCKRSRVWHPGNKKFPVLQPLKSNCSVGNCSISKPPQFKHQW